MKMPQVSNAQLVEKAVITADAIAAAGKLNPVQADKFIDYVFDETMMKNNARTIKFKPEELTIDKIGVGGRVAVAATEAADPGLRRGISTSKVSLQPAEVMVPFEISDTFGEINIEGMDVEDHIVRMMATVFGNDLEEYYINGNALGPAIEESVYKEGGQAGKYVKDAFIGLGDGWLKKAESGQRVDIANENINSTIFSRLLNGMPNKFKRDRGRLRFFCAPELEQNYREKIAGRATAKGDVAISSNAPLTPYGVPLIPVPLLSLEPYVTQHVVMNTDNTTPTALAYKPVSNLVMLPSGLEKTPTTPYTEGSAGDYNLDAVNGTVTRHDGGTDSIPSGATVKVTYQVKSRILLTHWQNFIVGIGRDIRIEKARDIFKRVNQYAITAKVAVAVEENTALVDGYNVGTALT
jgi:hypothetical protein